MTMQAKSSAPWGPVRAFTGREYVTYEWRAVSPEHEDDARAHPYLDVRDNRPVQVDATDAARELAAEHGIDLSAVEGTGEEGRVLVSDVRALVDEEE